MTLRVTVSYPQRTPPPQAIGVPKTACASQQRWTAAVPTDCVHNAAQHDGLGTMVPMAVGNEGCGVPFHAASVHLTRFAKER